MPDLLQPVQVMRWSTPILAPLRNRVQVIICASLLTLPLLVDGGLLHISGYGLLAVLLWLLMAEHANTTSKLVWQPLAMSMVAYLGYLWLSGLWSESLTVGRLFEDFGKFVNILGFVAAVTILRQQRPDILNWAEILFMAAASIIAAVAIARFLWLINAGMLRLKGFGTAENEVIAGMLFGVAAIFLIGKHLNSHGSQMLRWAGWSAVFILIAAIVLTKSRGPIAALCVSLGVLCILDARYLRPLLLTLGIAVAVLFSTGLVNLDALLERGFSYRLELWRLSVDLASQSPLLGHGAASKISLVMADGAIWTFPHNVFLTVLVFGGIIGLVLLVALMGMLFTFAWRARFSVDRVVLFLLVFGFVCGLTDRQIDLRNLSPEYVYFWYPAAILLGRSVKSYS
jgi:O-antigen ligase